MLNDDKFYTNGTDSLLTSSLFVLVNAINTLHKFDLNFVEDGEMRDYFNVAIAQLVQLQDLLKLTRHFAEVSKVEGE